MKMKKRATPTRKGQAPLPSAFFDESKDKVVGDGRKVNNAVRHFIRDDYIRKKMTDHEREFTERKNIDVFVGTWNVNGKKVGENLTPWLRPRGQGKRPDVYVIGFQEMVELNAQSVLLNQAMPGIESKSKDWQNKIERVINKGIPETSEDRFVPLESGYLVGVMLCVFATKRLNRNISEIAIQYAGVGYGGFMGNKGGVAIRFRAFDSTFCYLCAHLAAHRDKVKERNNDFASLSRKIVFEVSMKKSSLTSSSSGSSDVQQQYVNVEGHDVLVWLGDFNYRIDSRLSVDDVNMRCDKKDIEFLLRNDQLNKERSQGRVFQNFEEGKITFMPTYKYQPKTNKYERRPDKKKRAPAWCDRVLWLSSRKEDVRQIKYDRAELLTSDHKPVYALFQMHAKRVIEKKKAQVLEKITYSLDKWENEQLPQVELSEHQLNFDSVFYEERAERTLEIRNVGKTVAAFRFVPKLEEKQFCKPWMTIHPKFGMLMPGETANIHITAHVDYRTARNFATKRDRIEDILILRLENGRDFFISIAGEYVPSSFGMLLEDLTDRPNPIRCEKKEEDVSKEEEDKNNTRLQIPKELWRLCDLLFSNSLLTTKNLFIEGGLPTEMANIRESLDTGVAFSACSPHSAVAVLFEFLHSLATPILPPKLFSSEENDNVDSSRLATWCSDILSAVKPLQYNVFVYLLLFFKEALSHADENNLRVDILIRILTPRLAWNEREDLVDPKTVKRYRRQVAVFLKYLLTQDYF